MSSPRSYFAEEEPVGLSYDDYLAWLSEFLMQLSDEVPECQNKLWLSLEDCINPAMWTDAEREFKEMQAAGFKDPDDHKIDQGYRAILAKIVKQMDTQHEHIKLLDIYFKAYCENASK